nr:hypothetical protein [Actinomycetota bacterium]
MISVRSASTREALRVATIAVLLVVTVIGLRARGTFSRTPDAAAAGATGAALATVLTACEGVAVVAFVVMLVSARRQRVPRKSEPGQLIFPWWAKTLGVLLAVALLATPPFILITSRARKHTPAPPPLAHLTNPVSGASLNSPAASPAWPLIAGLVIAIAVVLAAALLT